VLRVEVFAHHDAPPRRVLSLRIAVRIPYDHPQGCASAGWLLMGEDFREAPRNDVRLTDPLGEGFLG
jgi:hypothetical protein